MTDITIPVGQIPERALPPPVTWEPVDLQEMRQSSRESGFVFSHLPDPDLEPTGYVLNYSNLGGEAGNALRAHYRDFALKVWDWLPPGATDPVKVRYAEPTSIAWNNNMQNVGARVVLEKVLAHE